MLSGWHWQETEGKLRRCMKKAVCWKIGRGGIMSCNDKLSHKHHTILVFLARAACSDDAKCIPLHHSPPSKVLRCRWTRASSRLQRLSDRHRLTHLWQQARLHFLSILNLQVSISPVQILKRSRSVTSKGRYHIRFRLCSEANRDYAIRYEAQKS